MELTIRLVEGDFEFSGAPPRHGEVWVMKAGGEQQGAVSAFSKGDLDGMGGDSSHSMCFDKVAEQAT